MTDEKPRFSDRIFRMALAVLPSDFRANYAGEMQRVFHEQQREAGEKEGFAGLLKLWWETLTGILTTAPREHWEMLKQDVSYALRMMRKNYGFTLVAVLTLALGIGANTAIFSVVNAVLLSPLPYPKGGQLVILRQQAEKQGVDDLAFSVKEIQDYRSQNGTFSGVAEYHSMTFTLLGRDEPLRVQTGVVSANFFDMFGIRPIQGRTFRDDDDKPGAPAVLLVSYEFWKNSLGGDPNIVGKTFRMNDKTHTIIGVLPPVPQYPNENDVYMPTSACPFRGSKAMMEGRDHRMMNVFARMKDGVKLGASQADVATVAGRFALEYPALYPASMGFRTIAVPLKGELIKDARPTLLILLGATGFVLLIACANVANLTLSRMTQRERELAVRSALGAGKTRLLRQLLTESVMIAGLGAVLGLLFASGGMDLLQEFALRFTPRAREIRIDYVVLLFTFVVAGGTSIVFGSLAAFLSRESLAAGLKEGTGGASASQRRHRVRSVLIVTQIALSFLLLTGAGLMLRSFVRLQRVDPGFVPQHILAMKVSPNFTKYTQNEQYRALGHRMLEAAKTRPGVMSVAISSSFPFDPDSAVFGLGINPFVIQGRPLKDGEAMPTTTARIASPDYFGVLGIPLIEGRTFNEADTSEAPQVAIINQTLARHLWPGDDPVGHSISFDEGKMWIKIVGIVGDTKELTLDHPADNEVYLPLDQYPQVSGLLVRTFGDPMSVGREIRQSVYDVDPDTALTHMQSLETARSATLASPRLTTDLLAVFAGLALVMAATGIGGIMALTVSQRLHEIGIRMALGAKPRDILGMVLRQGLGLGLSGIVLGLLAAIALTRLLQTLLFEISPTDPVTFAAVGFVLVAAAVISCLIPARRAAKTDPLVALRFE
jgi:predicted permease